MHKLVKKAHPANLHETVHNHKAFRALSTAPRPAVINCARPESAVLHECSTRVHPHAQEKEKQIQGLNSRLRDTSSVQNVRIALTVLIAPYDKQPSSSFSDSTKTLPILTLELPIKK